MTSRLQQFVTLFGFNFILWLLLTGSLKPAELVAGFIVATVAAMLVVEKVGLFGDLRISPQAPLAFLRYLGVFLVALVRANLDMARRVLSPSLPIRPGLVRIRTTLESDLGKLVLANSITLTPGTLSVDVEGDEILVHWIDCPSTPDMALVTQQIAGLFEPHIKGFLR